MIQDKKTLQTVTSVGEYLAPSVKVKELRNRKVLCASAEGNFSLNKEDIDDAGAL